MDFRVLGREEFESGCQLSEEGEKQPRFANDHSGARAVRRGMVTTEDGVSLGTFMGCLHGDIQS